MRLVYIFLMITTCFITATEAKTCSIDEYLRQRPDVRQGAYRARQNVRDFVMIHYRNFGRREGMCQPVANYRPPVPQRPNQGNAGTCSAEEYLNKRPDVRRAAHRARQNAHRFAVQHYQNFGRREGMCRPIIGYNPRPVPTPIPGPIPMPTPVNATVTKEDGKFRVTMNATYTRLGGFNLGGTLKGKRFNRINKIVIFAKALEPANVSFIDSQTGMSKPKIEIPMSSYANMQSNRRDSYARIAIKGLNIPNIAGGPRINVLFGTRHLNNQIKVKDIVVFVDGGGNRPGPGPGREPMCGSHRVGQTWYVQQGTMEVESSCPRRPRKTKVELFKREVEMVCEARGRRGRNATAFETGRDRQGDFIKVVQACPKKKEKKKCGNKEHGAKWFVNEGQTSETKQCGGNQVGSIVKYFHQQVEYQCKNGVKSKTGKTQKGSLVSQSGSCQPKAKKKCGNKAHGAKWFVNEGQTSETIACGGNQIGNIIKSYNQKVEYQCNDGVKSKTGNKKRGSLIDEDKSSCQAAPKKSCGDKAHGETWFEVNGEMKEQRQCKKKPEKSIFVIFEKKVEYSCNDGSKVATGNTEKGERLRRDGKCGNGNGGNGGGGRGGRNGGGGNSGS